MKPSRNTEPDTYGIQKGGSCKLQPKGKRAPALSRPTLLSVKERDWIIQGYEAYFVVNMAKNRINFKIYGKNVAWILLQKIKGKGNEK